MLYNLCTFVVVLLHFASLEDMHNYKKLELLLKLEQYNEGAVGAVLQQSLAPVTATASLHLSTTNDAELCRRLIVHTVKDIDRLSRLAKDLGEKYSRNTSSLIAVTTSLQAYYHVTYEYTQTFDLTSCSREQILSMLYDAHLSLFLCQTILFEGL